MTAHNKEGVHTPRYSFKECFETMRPLINPQLLPTSLQPKQTQYLLGSQQTAAQGTKNSDKDKPTYNNNRRKFSRMDDNLMILGLHEFGQKAME